MTIVRRGHRLIVAGTVAGGLLMVGCTVEQLPQSPSDSQHPDASVGAVGRPDAGPSGSSTCVQALAEPLPARIAAMSSASSSTAGGSTVVTEDSIYNLFWSKCSACHPSQYPAFNITSGADLAKPGAEGFKTKGEEAAWHIHQDGTIGAGVSNEAMPPIDATKGSDGLGWTARLQKFPNDPLVQAYNLIQEWVSKGRPPMFSIAAPAPSGPASDDGGAPASYVMSAAVGNGMTNLGNCIPDTSIVATEQSQSDALDQMFANLKQVAPGFGSPAEVIGLPEKLSDTDLKTFDAEALARMGVIAFVPQYPLWSDDAGKIRHVRVPRGHSIQFNKGTQEFKIPANTRFYKTFLKRIVDTDGNPSWRKIETRLIVSRPDAQTNGTRDGVVSPTTALFGSYLWNAAETDAILIGSGKAPRDLVDPISMSTFDQQLKEGDGFPDTILAYETNAGTHETRHYAVPSATRCIQCHMGSSSQSFVLGFRPVELRHWPVGQQGVIEESGYDEMQLLQRLIDYGIVTGMASPSDVLPLDQQGDRPPRNDKELTAQGYALGNCAHCHNPRGYPSITFPILKDTNFSLLPGPAGGPIGHMGGLFQFPLEKTSPRITRGTAGDVQIAYITPSLVDNPSFPSGLDPNTGDTAPISRGSSWKPKWQSSGNGTAGFVYAPWRSLIYRNLDTPFTDTDDFAIFPHMPMNIPGYDPRAKLVFADWMVSIPAVRKRPDIDEYAAPYPYDSSECEASSQVRFARCPPYSDDNVQPYVEVTPGQPGYDDAFQAAEERLATFHAGARPSDTAIVKNRCAYTPNTTDILDPAVLKDPVCNPIPDESGNPPLLNIPEHPHWVQLDLTHTPGPWVPRRPDWSSVFNNGSLRCADPSGAATGAAGTCSGVVPNGALSCSVVPASFSANVTKNEQCVVDTLNGGAGCALGQPADTNTPGGVTLDPVIRTYADPANPKTQVPMGLWKEKPECNWTREPWKSQGETVAQARAVKPHPAWLDRPEIDPMAHVYKQVPGEAVFGMICVNCHGPNADSRGRLADNLATMTGGSALVADFLDGLFGPACPAGHCTPSPGSYRADVFSNGAPPNEAAIGVDDRAARYMAWMALGGTKVVIPKSFLTIVGQSPVFGESRPGTLPPPPSANMLSIVRELCLQTLQAPPFDPRYFGGTSGIAGSAYLSGSHKGGYSMLWDNGDAELWLRLCAINNPPPLAQYVVNGGTGGFPLSFLDYSEANEPGTKDEATGLTPQRSLLRCAFDGTGCAADAGVAAPQCYSVGDESGNVFASAACAQPGPGLTSPGFDSSGAPVGNWHPWCVDASFNPGPTDPWLRSHCLSGTDCDMSSGNCLGSNCVSPPRCPDGAALDPDGSAALWWAQRGAINAGLAVFLYLDAVTKHTSTVYPIKPTWDHCELLAPASP